MRKQYSIVSGLILVAVLTALFLGLFPFGSEPLPKAEPPKVQAQDTQVPKTTGEVAGVHTVAHTPPKQSSPVRVVVSDGTKSRTITYTPPHAADQPPGQGSEPDTPQQPQPPAPTEVTINLRGPLEYHLQPGKQSPILTYELTDGAQYQWLPGLLTGWIDSATDAQAPVQGTVLERRPSRPYVDDHVHFVVAARDTAPPGVYKVSVKMVIRPGITLGLPVMVTVPNVR